MGTCRRANTDVNADVSKGDDAGGGVTGLGYGDIGGWVMQTDGVRGRGGSDGRWGSEIGRQNVAVIVKVLVEEGIVELVPKVAGGLVAGLALGFGLERQSD